MARMSNAYVLLTNILLSHPHRVGINVRVIILPENVSSDALYQSRARVRHICFAIRLVEVEPHPWQLEELEVLAGILRKRDVEIQRLREELEKSHNEAFEYRYDAVRCKTDANEANDRCEKERSRCMELQEKLDRLTETLRQLDVTGSHRTSNIISAGIPETRTTSTWTDNSASSDASSPTVSKAATSIGTQTDIIRSSTRKELETLSRQLVNANGRIEVKSLELEDAKLDLATVKKQREDDSVRFMHCTKARESRHEEEVRRKNNEILELRSRMAAADQEKEQGTEVARQKVSELKDKLSVYEKEKGELAAKHEESLSELREKLATLEREKLQSIADYQLKVLRLENDLKVAKEAVADRPLDASGRTLASTDERLSFALDPEASSSANGTLRYGVGEARGMVLAFNNGPPVPAECIRLDGHLMTVTSLEVVFFSGSVVDDLRALREILSSARGLTVFRILAPTMDVLRTLIGVATALPSELLPRPSEIEVTGDVDSLNVVELISTIAQVAEIPANPYRLCFRGRFPLAQALGALLDILNHGMPRKLHASIALNDELIRELDSFFVKHGSQFLNAGSRTFLRHLYGWALSIHLTPPETRERRVIINVVV